MSQNGVRTQCQSKCDGNVCVVTRHLCPAHKLLPTLGSDCRAMGVVSQASHIRWVPEKHKQSNPLRTTVCVNDGIRPTANHSIGNTFHANASRFSACTSETTRQHWLSQTNNQNSSSDSSSRCAWTTKSLSSRCRSRYCRKAGDRHSPACNICQSGAPETCRSIAWPRLRS